MTNVDGIMNYKPKEEEDYYAILGCDESATAEQINAEYKVQALQYHPDKNAGDKAAEEKFQKLQEAKEILSDPDKRRNYDKWRKSGIAISYKQWLGMKEHVHQKQMQQGALEELNAWLKLQQQIAQVQLLLANAKAIKLKLETARANKQLNIDVQYE